MKELKRWTPLVILIIVVALLAGCAEADVDAVGKEEPVSLEPIEGTDLNMVHLTERAAQRLDIQTDVVREEQVDGTTRMVVPYATVLYGLNGETWVYVSPASLMYHRQPVTVDYVDGDTAVLKQGPAPGTPVVTVGVAELYGADTGVGK